MCGPLGFEVLSVVPWKPALGRPGDLGGIAQELGQIVEGVLPCELAGMDEAQEHIPHVSTVLGLEEIGILAVENGALQLTFRSRSAIIRRFSDVRKDWTGASDSCMNAFGSPHWTHQTQRRGDARYEGDRIL